MDESAHNVTSSNPVRIEAEIAQTRAEMQNKHTPLIEAALAPARRRFTKPVYQKLCAALALIFGTESMIVFQDVLGLDEKTARKVKSWAARVLVRAALNESAQANRSRSI